MEFLKLVRRRSFLSEVVYMTLNVVLAIAVLIVIRYTESIPLAIGLVVISKWRVFAVRPRYWFVNLQANLVDFIVSISVVIHLYTINMPGVSEYNKLLLLGAMTALYIAWLLFLKPRSQRGAMAVQAGIAIVSGVAALFTVSYAWPASLVVLLMWLIGYAAAHHVLSSYDNETHGTFIGLAWGFIFAEIGWIAYHVAIAHQLPFINSIAFPQVALVALLVSFIGFKAYDSFYHHQKVRSNDIVLPVLFTVGLLVALWVVLPWIQCQSPMVLLCLEPLQ